MSITRIDQLIAVFDKLNTVDYYANFRAARCRHKVVSRIQESGQVRQAIRQIKVKRRIIE